ncbi:MAG TPA: chorismate mutase, partial [Chloroflexota bacterium]
MELDELRAEIDEVDWELVQLLNRRAKLSLRVGQVKR